MKEVIILGAGIAGIATGYFLNQENKKEYKVTLYEKNSSWGGLCDNFEIGGFRFDKFIHLSFTNNELVKELFQKSSDSIEHIPNASNYYHGYWLKHPAQNNLFPLSFQEKNIILKDFISRKSKDIENISNYEEWLKIQYGEYFAVNFPMKYTRKYWGVEAKELESKWVGNRMYKPTVEEVKLGMETAETPVTYYAKKMYYPKNGGYKSFLNYMTKEVDIKTNFEVNKIDLEKRKVFFTNRNFQDYDTLISSLPLPELVKVIENLPESIKQAASLLRWTSGYIVSLGLKTTNIPPYLWFYIYDENILPARVYSSSHKSADNCPIGCSSLQLEIYHENNNKIKLTEEDILEHCIEKLVEMKVIKMEDIIVRDIRYEKYANVVFDFNVYKARKIIRDYFKMKGIETIGRFGEWDYLWSDQSLLSGKNVVREFYFGNKDN